jgi:hypothetical protein
MKGIKMFKGLDLDSIKNESFEPIRKKDNVLKFPKSIVSRFICENCEKHWVAVFYEGTKKLECPRCHYMNTTYFGD